MEVSQKDLARNIIDKFIALSKENKKSYSKRFLATVLYEENPNLFKDVETARSTIRRVLNASGSRNFDKKNIDLTARFALIEQEYRELDYKPFIIPKQYNNTLFIADPHSRFCDMEALRIAIEYGVKKNCNSVFINGDFMDHYQYSRFDKNPLTLAQFYSEREWGQDVLQLLQDCFGKVFLKKGNHDLRREQVGQTLSAKFPEIETLMGYDDYLRFDGSTVEFIEDYNHAVYGKLNIIHGHEYQGGGGIHAAYNRLGKTMDNTMSAHSHISQSIIKKDINDNVFGSWTLGALCDLHPRYCPKNNWNHGFAIVERNDSGDFEVENKIIHNKKIFNV